MQHRRLLKETRDCLASFQDDSWRGPCRVTAKLSATSYRVEHVQTGRKFTRSIMNVSKWPGNTIDVPVDADDDQQLSLDDFQINDLIAVLDDAGDTEWHLARVTDIVDGHLEVHYFGTSGQALSSAKFRPVYIDDGDQRPLLRANGLRHNGRASPWTGRIPITADLIIVDKMALRSNGRLTAASKSAVEAFEHLNHHVCLLYTSPSPRDKRQSRMPSSA